MNKRNKLAATAEKIARRPIADGRNGISTELRPILAPFLNESDGKRFDWCSAFVYYCCIQAGINLPSRHPEPVRCSFAGAWGWVDWAKLPGNRFYFSARNVSFFPMRGDLVVFDNLLNQGVCDHIGVILSCGKFAFRTAEGNVDGISRVMRRDRDRKVRGFIRIPNEHFDQPRKKNLS